MCACDSNDNILSSEVMRLLSRRAQKMRHSSREPQDRHLAAQDASLWVTGNQGAGIPASSSDFPTQLGKQQGFVASLLWLMSRADVIIYYSLLLLSTEM